MDSDAKVPLALLDHETDRRQGGSEGAMRAIPVWARRMTRLLDDIVTIPGTKIGLGLDSIIGFFFPGAGDALTGLSSAALLFVALRVGVPRVVVARMVMNIAIDAVLGAIPLAGDIFDVAWKASRKNLELIERHELEPRRPPSAADYALVGLGLLLLVMAVLLPLLLVAVIAGGITALFSKP
jgi:hypothetical protein